MGTPRHIARHGRTAVASTTRRRSSAAVRRARQVAVAGVLLLALGGVWVSLLLVSERSAREDRADRAASEAATTLAHAVDDLVAQQVVVLSATASTALASERSDAALRSLARMLGLGGVAVVEPSSGVVLAADRATARHAAALRPPGAMADDDGPDVDVVPLRLDDGRPGLGVRVVHLDRVGRRLVLSALLPLDVRTPHRGAVVRPLGSALRDLLLSSARGGTTVALLSADDAQVLLRVGAVDGPLSATAPTATGHVVRVTGDTAGLLPGRSGGLPLPAALALCWIVILAVALAVLATARAVRLADEARRESQATARSRADFVAIASHELRTPVAIVHGMLETLAGRWDLLRDDDRRELVARAEGAGRRLAGIVTDVMTASLAERGRLQVRSSEVTLADLAAEGVAGSRAQALPGAALVVDVPVDGPVVRTDRSHVARMLGNLLDNAVKYGQPPLRVCLRLDRETLVLQVVDHGAGVPDEEVEAIFSQFWQSDGHRADRGGGIGLGLHLVLRIADTLGGSVDHERRDGRTTFEVRLPVELVDTATGDVPGGDPGQVTDERPAAATSTTAVAG